MTISNNDILRRIRYTFDINDSGMIAIFGLGGHTVTRAEISDWLKKEDDPAYKSCEDTTLAVFLNGFIIDRRGPKDGPLPVPETQLTNNIIFRKLKIALDLKAEDVLEVLEIGGFSLSKHELSAFFRKPGHKHFRECKDQVMRKFLYGIQMRYRSKVGIENVWKTHKR